MNENALEQLLSAYIAEPVARARWVTAVENLDRDARTRATPIALPIEDFVAHLGTVLVAIGGTPPAPSELLLSDLHLAAACAAGRSEAVAELRSRAEPELQAALFDAGGRADQVEEMIQATLAESLTDRAEGPAPIRQYRGRGSLVRWLRTVAVRKLVKARRCEQRQAGDERLETHVGQESPELEHLKQRYRPAFAAAFAGALASLSPQQRTLLRQSIIDGLTIDELGPLHKVHRATVARWLHQARETLALRTRDALMVSLKLARHEAESLIRLIHTQLDLSLRRELASQR